MTIENNINIKNIVSWASSEQNSLVFQLDGDNSLNPRRKKTDINQLILTKIEQDPGITYKDLLRKTALSNGSLSWNIKVLEARKKLRVSRSNSGYTHLYPMCLDENTCSLLTEIRRAKAREIIFLLVAARNGYCTMKEISSAIKKAPSTTWWYIKRMCLKGIIFKKTDKRTPFYYLQNSESNESTVELLSLDEQFILISYHGKLNPGLLVYHYILHYYYSELDFLCLCYCIGVSRRY